MYVGSMELPSAILWMKRDTFFSVWSTEKTSVLIYQYYHPVNQSFAYTYPVLYILPVSGKNPQHLSSICLISKNMAGGRITWVIESYPKEVEEILDDLYFENDNNYESDVDSGQED